MFIVKYRKIFFILTAVIIATAIFSVAFSGSISVLILQVVLLLK